MPAIEMNRRLMDTAISGCLIEFENFGRYPGYRDRCKRDCPAWPVGFALDTFSGFQSPAYVHAFDRPSLVRHGIGRIKMCCTLADIRLCSFQNSFRQCQFLGLVSTAMRKAMPRSAHSRYVVPLHAIDDRKSHCCLRNGSRASCLRMHDSGKVVDVLGCCQGGVRCGRSHGVLLE